MADIVPPDALRQRQPRKVERAPFRWGALSLILLALAAGGWAYYHFDWLYRLPQERTLTTVEGKKLDVRVEGRTGELLRLTQLGDGTQVIYPIAMLGEADQVFANKLPAGAALQLPMSYVLRGAKGEAQAVTLMGYNDFMVQYATAADPQKHYMPLADLSPVDRAVLTSLPHGLELGYPLDYFFVDAAGARTPVKILARNDLLVKYLNGRDQSAHLRPIRQLSNQDQAVLQALPLAHLDVEYPVDYALFDADGKVKPVQILGRSNDLVKYVRTADGVVEWKPLIKLTQEELSLVELLPLSLTDRYPVAAALPDETGKLQPVAITARSKDLVEFVRLGPGESVEIKDAEVLYAHAAVANEAHYCLLSALAPASQEVVRLYPVNLRLSYPFSCTLTDKSGKSQKVKVLGQTWTTVKFSLLTDGKTYDYDVANLSGTDRDFLGTLPKNLKAEAPPPPIPNVVQALRQAMVSQQQKISRLQNGLAATNITDIDRGKLQAEITAAKSEADHDYAEITKNFSDRILDLQRQVISLEGQLTNTELSTDEKNVLQDQIDKNNSTINAFRAQLKAMQSTEPTAG